MNGEWQAQDRFGREYRIRQVMPPESLADAIMTQIYRTEKYNFAGFIDGHGRRLMKITLRRDPQGAELWVRVTPQAVPQSAWVFDFTSFTATTGTTR